MGKDNSSPTPAPEDNVNPLNYKEQFSGRRVTSQFIDPCEAASKASMDCMERNDYDRDACLNFFQAYRDCKGTWIEQRKQDRRAGRA
jgi:cytochrome c oxidase assembly protein subunit 23